MNGTTFSTGIDTRTLTADQRRLVTEFETKWRDGTLDARVQGIGTMRVMGQSGDQVLAYPQVDNLAVGRALPEAEAFVLAYAEAVAAAKVTPDTQRKIGVSDRPDATAYDLDMVTAFDPSKATTIIFSRLVGG